MRYSFSGSAAKTILQWDGAEIVRLGGPLGANAFMSSATVYEWHPCGRTSDSGVHEADKHTPIVTIGAPLDIPVSLTG